MAVPDEIARMRAEMDQGREGLKELARTIWGFYNELLSSGFSEEQALDLAKAWFLHLLGSASASGMLEQMFQNLGGDES